MYIKLKPFLVIAWLAVSAASAKHGCLKVIPGSHKWKPLEHAEGEDGDSAMLVRGKDDFGHFDLETPPVGEATPENIERQHRALEMITTTMYEGSNFTPKGLTG